MLRRTMRQHSTLALAVLLAASLSVVEPVLCIVHCALWMSLAPPAQNHPDHEGRHAMVMPDGSVMWMDGMSMLDHPHEFGSPPTTPAASVARGAQPTASSADIGAGAPAASTCLLRAAPGHAPHEPLAQPLHELFWLGLLLLVIPHGVTGAARMLDSIPDGLGHRPPLRPPRTALRLLTPRHL